MKAYTQNIYNKVYIQNGTSVWTEKKKRKPVIVTIRMNTDDFMLRATNGKQND